MGARGWRDGDLRGGWGPRPESVSQVVRHAYLGLRAARWGETLLLSIAGVLLTLAAAVHSGAFLAEPGAWAVSIFAGALLGASWFLEHRVSKVVIARRLDRELRHQGALVTAFELEQRDRSGEPFARLLADRVLERLRCKEALRCVLPPLALPVAMPVLAFCALAVALDHAQPDTPRTARLGDLGQGMAAELEEATRVALGASEQGRLDAVTAGRLVRAKARAQELARELEGGEQSAEELAALDRELARLESELVGQPDLRQPVEASRAWLDAARQGVDAAKRNEPGGESRPGLAAPGTDATMVGSKSPGGSPDGAAAPPSTPSTSQLDLSPGTGESSPERASLAGRDLPAPYRSIIQGWVESRSQR